MPVMEIAISIENGFKNKFMLVHNELFGRCRSICHLPILLHPLFILMKSYYAVH